MYKPYLRNCIGKYEKEVLLAKKMRQGMTKLEAEAQMRKENGVLIRQEKAKIYNDTITETNTNTITKSSKEQIFDLLTTANEKSNKNVNKSKEFSYEEYWEKHK